MTAPRLDSAIAWPPILREGRNCWRVVRAERLTPIVDLEDYFRAAREAILKARRSILLVGWTFDPRTGLLRGAEGQASPDRIGELLSTVARRRPGLDVRVLIWKMPLPYSLRNDLFPQRATRWFEDGAVAFRLDAGEHTGASHHQKILVVDDSVAFCGGGDLASGRWDTIEHLDNDPRRRNPSGASYPARHEVMMAVAGPAAAALADIARERWRRATGEMPRRPSPSPVEAVWPESCETGLTNVRIGISRTAAALANRQAVRENEALFLDSIAAARRSIYLENQYFSAPGIGAAIAARLEEQGGPEIVIVCTHRSPGFLDGLCMDAARDAMVARLRDADRYNRFRIHSPRTREGEDIIVHAKVAVIDDRLLRIGSCNIANRSMGFDTECDLSLAASGAPGGRGEREFIIRFRNRLLGHYLGAAAEDVASALQETGSLGGAIESLDRGPSARLPSLEPRRLGFLKRLIARYHLGDPEGAGDAWRPWRRGLPTASFDGAASSWRSATRGR